MPAWIAHVYTALGAVLAFAALTAEARSDVRGALLALAAATLVDATDGALARALRAGERLPRIDGARLDDIVDYLTYVFVPAFIVWHERLVPGAAAPAVVAAMLLSSAYGFAQVDAKVRTSDHFFTGFPSYWNIVALYLVAWRLPGWLNAAMLLGLAALVFVPIRYVYPTRTVTWRPLTLGLAAVWAPATAVLIWRLPATDGPWLTLSFAYVVYYFGLSIWLHARQTA